ncbi:uncharacterized protein LOC126992931 isoform X2 [Eriocheir sinensis]|uniref:uncharacterized protein LOC126992931 isoform X2 n=1 Tax=Eriocheir sinensis TaxID=95602 RepID=UPI0021C880DF|nr:uncharacterized protein LOC126992931 isoform X2 [Eriocheir sinensis]
MAAFPPSVCFRLKLLRVLEAAGQQVLTYTLRCGTPGKNPKDTFIEYLDKLPGTSTAKYKNTKHKGKCFDKTQKDLIRNDASCSKFDISLLWKAITEGCEGWDDPANHQAQSLIKKIKDTRNEVVHGAQKDMDETEFLKKIDELQDDFIKTLEATKVKYNTDGVECDRKKNEIKKIVNDIRDEKLSEDEILRRSVGDLLPHFRKEADEELKQKLSSAKLLDPLYFLSGQENHWVEVQDIFSDIVIQEEKNEKKNIDHLKLLTLSQGRSTPSSPHIILVEGDAGSGKTTLLTYILSEYLKEKSGRRMEGLDYYHLILWVVCRTESSPTFEGLLMRLLAETHSRYGSLVMPLLKRTSVLIIIDALDEMNDASHLLVRDILNQCEYCPEFTLLATSRPEAIQTMKANTPKTYKLSHLKLEGISVDKRTELAVRHYRWLCVNIPGDEPLLRQVMEEVAWRQIFRLPLNILFFVTFFYIEPQKLTTTITQTKLYQKILDWCVEKLRHRLAGSPKVPKEPLLGIRIKHFLLKCYKIALNGIIHSKIYLSDDDIIQLTDFCEAKDLPVQDTLAAFYSLRQAEVGGVRTAQYHAPHKGLQDFFAAWHIHERLNNNYKAGDIRHLLDSTAGQNLQLFTLNNTLSHLLGLLSYHGNPNVTAVEETVDLLQESGMRTEIWMYVLADTEVNINAIRRVAHHINSDHNKGLFVDDSTLHIATALLPHIHRKNVFITLKRDQSGIETLSSGLSHNVLINLTLKHHFQHPRPDTSSFPLLQKLPRNDLNYFMGHLDADHLTLLPKGLWALALVVAGDGHAQSLLPALEHIRVLLPNLRLLDLHVPVSAVSTDSLTALPYDVHDVNLRLSGVDNEKMKAAVDVARALHPRQGSHRRVA